MFGKILTGIILAVIIAVAFFAIRKRIRDIKRGKICSCSSCDGCKKRNSDNE